MLICWQYNLIKKNFNNFNSLFNEFIRDLLFKNFNERKLFLGFFCNLFL